MFQKKKNWGVHPFCVGVSTACGCAESTVGFFPSYKQMSPRCIQPWVGWGREIILIKADVYEKMVVIVRKQPLPLSI